MKCRPIAYQAIALPLSYTAKTWRSQGVTIPFFQRDRLMCVHEHFETKFGGCGWSRTSSAFRAADLQSTGVTNFPTHPNMVEPDGIEPLAATPLINGYRVTAGNGEQAPNLLTHSSLRVPFLRQEQVVRNVCIKKHCSFP